MIDMEDRELHLKHRPKKLLDLLGQPDAVKTLEGFFAKGKVPHAILIRGPSGCGKTTIGRIIKRKLKCSDHDFQEINAADSRGIDTIREIRQTMSLAPMNGDCRIWLIDEAASLVGLAQQALLKILEDTPSHVYFILATTDPNKLIKTIHTRCTQIAVSSLSAKVMVQLIRSVVDKEGGMITDAVVDRIVEASEGSARKALVILNQVIGLDKEEDRLEAIQKSDHKRVAFDIVKALLYEKTKWADMVKVLAAVDEEPESIRHFILACANTELMKAGPRSAKAAAIINECRDNWYDCKKAGLTIACWNVLSR